MRTVCGVPERHLPDNSAMLLCTAHVLLCSAPEVTRSAISYLRHAASSQLATQPFLHMEQMLKSLSGPCTAAFWHPCHTALHGTCAAVVCTNQQLRPL